MEISNLRDCPHHADVIADRGWSAWWADSGVSLAQYRAHLEPMIPGDSIPLALVAQDEGVYLGSVLVIESDLEDRPDYAPWIAALWVEPAARRRGVGARLIEAARKEAAKHGRARCYLCASSENTPYYLARGFSQIEHDVSGLNIFCI